jgi:hypothetical protein
LEYLGRHTQGSRFEEILKLDQTVFSDVSIETVDRVGGLKATGPITKFLPAGTADPPGWVYRGILS